MNNSKLSTVIDTLIKLSVATVLIIAATTRQQYGFYNFVRWAVMIPSIHFAYVSLNKKQVGLMIYFVSTAIIFNPLNKFWFQKHTWHLVDYLTAGIFISTIIFDWISLNNNSK